MKRILSSLILVLFLWTGASATSLMPIPCPQFLDQNGAPYAGGILTFWKAGTSALQNVYTDSTGAVIQSNPFTLDSAGRACNVWLTGYYKVQLQSSALVAIWTQDNISSMAATSLTNSEWLPQIVQLTYIGATQFSSSSGDIRPTFQLNRRIQAVVSAGTVSGYISAQSYNSGTTTTTITVVWDSGALDSGLSTVSLGILSAVAPVSYPQNLALTPLYQGATTLSTLTPVAGTIGQTIFAELTAQAGALTIAAPTGTPLDGQILMIGIVDNGTPQAYTWNGAYIVNIQTLPITSAGSASKEQYNLFIWSSTLTKWVFLSTN